ncbi:hypothetical protein K523DRAFT_325672 [Schizophyllum commune Tattone D]|nr:hypothetical protein K523DRAFT_325672 [Schizophyllum commune Tattone D]
MISVAADGGVSRRLGNQTGICLFGTVIVPDLEISAGTCRAGSGFQPPLDADIAV